MIMITCSNSMAFIFLILVIIPSSFEEDLNGVKCVERERLALVEFKSQLVDDYGRLSTWGDYDHEKDCCKWEGVSCDNRTNHVVALHLGGPNDYDPPTSPLRGNISQSLLELADLNYLDLNSNDFNGTQIPEFICSLGKLQHLDLGQSSFVGLVPRCLGNLSKLQYLDLNRNSLYKTNLDWLFGFQSLEYLDLSEINLQGTIILDSLGNLTSLSHLDLSFNNLDGISDALWNITSLAYLDLHYNIQLRGELNNVRNLSLPNLQYLDLSVNRLSGPVPNFSLCPSLLELRLNDNMFNGSSTESIGYLPQAEIIDISSNLLDGPISEAHLSNLPKLGYLYLSENSNLTVRINSSWNPPSQLKVLELASCKVGPHFPKWLQKLKQLESLDISNAKISDSVPDWCWDNMQMCQTLNMSYNQMYGVIPDLSHKLISLSFINLSSNKFNGPLPLLPSVARHINFSGNKFSGTIINSCNLSSLISLDLSDNLFSTQIPQGCFMNFTSLSYLNLANNNFSGEIPNSVDLICQVSSLHLRNNSFTGEILRSLKNCNNLMVLDLGENNFTGVIPDWLAESMPGLIVLSLSSNNLHGNLPWSLCHLQGLRALDISVNNISGTIPECLSNITVLNTRWIPWTLCFS